MLHVILNSTILPTYMINYSSILVPSKISNKGNIESCESYVGVRLPEPDDPLCRALADPTTLGMIP